MRGNLSPLALAGAALRDLRDAKAQLTELSGRPAYSEAGYSVCRNLRRNAEYRCLNALTEMRKLADEAGALAQQLEKELAP